MKIELREPYLSIFYYVQNQINDDTYLVGGFVRDTLLGMKSNDLDFATALDPNKVHSFFPDSLYFSKFGTTSFIYRDIHITIASLREEGDYIDFRHPSRVKFIRDITIDAKRRDFTINALYVNKEREIIDPTGLGLLDLQEKRIRMVGDPLVRLREDPLRIIRAYRFSYELGFFLDPKLEKEIQESSNLLTKLNPVKINEELNKISSDIRERIYTVLQL